MLLGVFSFGIHLFTCFLFMHFVLLLNSSFGQTLSPLFFCFVIQEQRGGINDPWTEVLTKEVITMTVVWISDLN